MAREIMYRCTRCGELLASDVRLAGHPDVCPECGAVNEVPGSDGGPKKEPSPKDVAASPQMNGTGRTDRPLEETGESSGWFTDELQPVSRSGPSGRGDGSPEADVTGRPRSNCEGTVNRVPQQGVSSGGPLTEKAFSEEPSDEQMAEWLSIGNDPVGNSASESVSPRQESSATGGSPPEMSDARAGRQIKYQCSHCHAILKSEPERAGRPARCPKCGQFTIVPGERVARSELTPSSESGGWFADEFQPPARQGKAEHRDNQPPMPTISPGPKGIGGWLIFPAIGLVLSPIRAVISWVQEMMMISAFAPEMKDDGRLWTAMCLDFLIAAGCVVVAIMFFMKLRVAVKAIIALLAAGVLSSLIQTMMVASMTDGAASATVLIGPVISAAIWIPYFLTSKRVKNTFVN